MTTTPQNVALPDPAFPNLIAVNWAPFVTSAPGVCGSSSSLTQTFHWVAAAPVDEIGPTVWFAARLHAAGIIDIMLMTGGAAGGTIGIQGLSPTDVISFPCGASCGPSDFRQAQ